MPSVSVQVQHLDYWPGDHKTVLVSIGAPLVPARRTRLPEAAMSFPEVVNKLRNVWVGDTKGWFDQEGVLQLSHKEFFSKWDSLKTRMQKVGVASFRKCRKDRTRELYKVTRAINKLERSCARLGSTDGRLSGRVNRLGKLRGILLALRVREGKERSHIQAVRDIQFGGKANKYFLQRRCKRAKPKIANITVGDSGNASSPRTDDDTTIRGYFDKFYRDLYSPKPVNKKTLSRMLDNMELGLNNRHYKALNRDAMVEEVEAVF